MNILPEDQERLSRIVEDMTVLQSKYSVEDFGTIFVQAFVGRALPKDLDEMGDDQKSALMALVVNGMNQGANIGTFAMQDLIFPFGHPGQSIEISE